MAANDEDVSLSPGPNADDQGQVLKLIGPELSNTYDVYSYMQGATVLTHSFPDEFNDIKQALLDFRISTFEIGMPGGNESLMPKKISSILRPLNWKESRIQGDLIVRVLGQSEPQSSDGDQRAKPADGPRTITLKNYIDGHKIDYVKGRVAFDLEWNSKDQTFDRDLYAFRMFHECGAISVAVLLTRSQRLNDVFKVVPKRDKAGNIETRNGSPVSCMSKYGASTTWMGKLLYRLNSGRHGGCPVVVFGITEKSIEDWPIRHD